MVKRLTPGPPQLRRSTGCVEYLMKSWEKGKEHLLRVLRILNSTGSSVEF